MNDFFNPFGSKQGPVLKRDGWKNKKGTSDRECPICGSWKTHWERITGKKFDLCSREGCPNRAEVGAHVFCPPDKQEWIVPLCPKCNNPNNTEPFNLRGEISLVSAVECTE